MKKMLCVCVCILAVNFTVIPLLPIFAAVDTLPQQMISLAGRPYTGHYMDAENEMYSVRKGKRTPKTGTLKAGTTYYDYHAGKMRKLSRETVYVKGKKYTGLYMSAGNRMYSVRKGTRTLKTGMLKAGMLRAGVSYYSHNAKKRLKLSAKAFYINGKPVKGMSAGALETLQRAHTVVTRITNGRMTKKEKLKACFDFVKTYPECSLRLHYMGMDWPVIYADDIFVSKTGNCFSYTAAFAYMAKAIGYGEVYCCNSGGHGWAEIDGLVYDPEWSKHSHLNSYYALSYDTHTDQDYKGAIAARRLWMHIKI